MLVMYCLSSYSMIQCQFFSCIAPELTILHAKLHKLPAS